MNNSNTRNYLEGEDIKAFGAIKKGEKHKNGWLKGGKGPAKGSQNSGKEKGEKKRKKVEGGPGALEGTANEIEIQDLLKHTGWGEEPNMGREGDPD